MKNWRINLVLACVCILGAVILGRLVILQISEHEFYKALAGGQQKIITPTIGQRGEIFFENGEPIAINKTGTYVFVCPQEIKAKQETAEKLAKILSIDQDWILEKIQKVNLFEQIKDKLSQNEQDAIKKESLTGVYLEKQIFRYYPQEHILANVIGFVSADQQGQYGIEGYYDEILKGKEILSEQEKGPSGFFDLSDTQQNSSGIDIVLTIDPNIQYMASTLLSSAQKKLKADGGEILVLEPASGKIIAMAMTPNFDPNNYSAIQKPEIFQNSIVQKIFEPGSVFKPITMAAAINENKITPQTTYIDKGIIRIGGWKILNYDERVWGEQTMTEVLEKSINTGAVFAEQSIGEKSFLNYITKLFNKLENAILLIFNHVNMIY